ncbi:hypothetical protein A6V36_27465 [Paraburkholderia ginsengiterrae]|uniref:Uncharacterized protein n=1 Tax=Paraburkholderia ginsengiterrae TaxID=1462993 RepID=A0A1A9NAV6_9BURK|nr:hypothetical protein [Paraburkholderia ginsengiterrae]OAJ59387.1 hypothetical protein A6V36_27465 [Paraburkholderia ginsengiterrae]OAJ63300.1 hypothetical protein A6V37_20615 [Paraburkholderia ginsengiterrae]
MNGEVGGMKYAYDALGTLLEAAIRDQKLTADAVKAMNSLTTAIEQQSRSMPKAIVADVNSQLATTIDAAATTLTSRVESANLAADKATKALERAATFSILRICAPALLASLAAMALWYGVTAWSVHRLEQQKTDLKQQKTDLEQQKTDLEQQKTDLEQQKTDLEQQKTDLEQQKTELEQRVAYLDSRGGRLDITSCRFDDGRSVPCIRVDETAPFNGGYRIPIRVK